MAAPVINITEATRTRISALSGFDQSQVTFETDQDLTRWEARADGLDRGQGILVGAPEWVRETWAEFEALGWTWDQLDSRRLTFNRLTCVQPASANVLLNPQASDPSWAKWTSNGYVVTQTVTYDGPLGPTESVANLQTTNPTTEGWFYCYQDKAPQMANTWHRVSLYVKALDAPASIYAYTADNTEAQQAGQRLQTTTLTVSPAQGWVEVTWPPIKTPANNISDSLSFKWWGSARIAVSAPRLVPVARYWVDNEELTAGDKTYRINTYGKNAAGEWTPYGG